MDSDKVEFVVSQSNTKDLADLLGKLKTGRNSQVEPDVVLHLIRMC